MYLAARDRLHLRAAVHARESDRAASGAVCGDRWLGALRPPANRPPFARLTGTAPVPTPQQADTLILTPCARFPTCQAFFGFQEIGHIIEEPFGKTKRLRALADSVGYSRLYGRLNDSNETPPRAGSAGSLAASEAPQKRKRAIQRMQASEAAREAEMFEAAVQAGLFIYT